jgi:DNA repair/transcription protein MET18/MMS19
MSSQLDDYWSSRLNNTSVPAETRKNAISTWISVLALYLASHSPFISHLQITRALLVRSHPSAHPFIDHLFELLDDSAVDWDAARALGLLACEDPVLTKRNTAVLKVCKYYSVCGVYLKKGITFEDSTRAKIL